jgi:hypothetical protein
MHDGDCMHHNADMLAETRNGSLRLYLSESESPSWAGSRLVVRSVGSLDMRDLRESAIVTWLSRKIDCDGEKSLAVGVESLGLQLLQAL